VYKHKTSRFLGSWSRNFEAEIVCFEIKLLLTQFWFTNFLAYINGGTYQLSSFFEMMFCKIIYIV